MNQPTPINTRSSFKRYVKIIGSVIVGLIILSVLVSSLFPENEALEKKQSTMEQVTDNLIAPQLIQKQQEKIIALPETVITQQREENAETQKLEKMRLAAPMSAFNTTNRNVSPTNTSSVFGESDNNTHFLNQLSSTQAPFTTATRLQHPPATIAQGAVIAATLETRIVSDLPGMVRAITSNDIYSEDGNNILIPRGSRLIGQYTNAIIQGQQRVFVVWQRLLRPDFIDIQLTSPGTDPLGTAGMQAASIDRHFFEQAGMAAVFSLLNAGVSNIGVDNSDTENSKTSYRKSMADSFNETAQQTFDNSRTIKPTLTIHQGTPISVFVGRDLDFSIQTTRKSF